MTLDRLQLRADFLARARGQELAELEMLSPIFDGEESEPQHRYLILSPPRSGSYWLCRQLWTAGLGLPFEYLNRLHLRRLAKRWGTPIAALQPRTRRQRLACQLGLNRWRQPPCRPGDLGPDLRAYLHAAERRRSLGGWFGLKVQPLHLQELQLDPAAAFHGWMVLPLLRRDQRRQLASYLFSRATGAYDTGLITSNEGEGLQQLEATHLQEETTALLVEQNRRILQVCRQRNLDPLWMEDLMAQPAGALTQRLLPYLPPLAGLEPGFQPLEQRGGPVQDAKQRVLQTLARSLPERLVSRLQDSLQTVR